MRERLRDFFDPARSIPLFIVGTAALTLFLQALYDLANEPGQWQGGYWLALGSLFIAVVALVVTSRRTPTPGRVGIREELKPNQRKGLIVLSGPTEASAPDAIEYHLPILEHCWIVSTKASVGTAAELHRRYESERVHIHYGSLYEVDEDQIESTYDLVTHILENEASEYELTVDDLIGDITGGLKPMTAGMTLACLARRCDLQYMKALRNEEGEILEGAQPEPIQIDVTFVPERLLGT
ncbi:MAG: hypothetical protein ACOC9Z_02285 [Chloroflexota bacterium]